MREKYLEIKVFIINLLIKLHLRKDVWHKSHIRLAKIRSDRMYSSFFGRKDNNHE